MQGIVRQWHQPTPGWQCLLRPLSWVYCGAIALRRAAWRWGIVRSRRLPVPVVVIGNLTVGGSGKTPLVGHLVDALAAAGWRPGIVSRGYRGRARAPCRVDRDSDPREVGDEPLMHALLSGRPVAVGADRVAAASLLVDDCDVIVADDGLQHYRLGRDVEIVVIDGDAGLGNGLLLPAGPLREPEQRLLDADFVAVRDGERERAWRYRVTPAATRRLIDGESRALAAWSGESVHAVAAIGVPGRFFGQLEDLGLEVERHGFADHHPLAAPDLAFGDRRPVLMTEKDAVKCRAFADERMWVVTAVVEDLDDLAGAVVMRLGERAAAATDVGPTRPR